MLNMLHFKLFATSLKRISNLPKWSCVLKFYSVPGAYINDNKDMELPFICFCRHKNISCCYFHKQLLTENGKEFPSCTNLDNSKNRKVATLNSLVLKSCKFLVFHSEYYIPSIEIFAFHIPHIYIIYRNQCTGKLHYMFDYKERFQVMSEKVHYKSYYGYKSIYMEGVALEHF